MFAKEEELWLSIVAKEQELWLSIVAKEDNYGSLSALLFWVLETGHWF